jgi:two-component system, sensor histidine kinase and response regulator
MAIFAADAGRPVREPHASRPASPGLFSRVFAATSEAIALVRPFDGTVVEANDAFVRLSGLEREEIVGASSFELGFWTDLGDPADAALGEQKRLDGLAARLSSPRGSRTLTLSSELIAEADHRESIVLVRATDPTRRPRVAPESSRAIRDAEARYRSLVEQLPAIIYTQVADRSSPTGYRDVYISPQTETKLGYTASEWRSDPLLWQKVTYIEDLDLVLREEDRTGRTGEPFSSMYRMVARDGRVLWFRDDAVLVRDPATGEDVWKGVMLDITDQKEAEERLLEAEARYRALIERIPAVVYHSELGVEGEWLYVSPQVEEIFGFSPQAWMDHPHPMASFCHPDDFAAMRAAEEHSYSTGEPFRAEYRMRTPHSDGWRWMVDEAAVVRGDDGRPLHMLGVMFDMTDRKRAEDAVREALAREKRASDRLRTMDILKSTLLHTLSHDLRNPLAAIHAAAATLQQLDGELQAHQRRELTAAIIGRTRKMDELLSDLLDLDRLDRGIVEPRLEEHDLGALVRRVVEEFTDADGRSIRVDVERLPMAVDRTKFERILENLLSNAVRHTPRGAPIAVSAVAVEDGALLSVEDEGSGVPDELKDAIFEEFRRGPDARGGGSGVGLSLVSRFATLHGGRAWVEDRPGGGASFRVLLPRAASVDAGAQPASVNERR